MDTLSDHGPRPTDSATAPPLDQWPAWMLGVLATLVCMSLYLPTATWDYDQITDTRATAIGAWSLADHGSIQVDTSWPDVPWAEQGPDGNYYIWRHPGGMVWSALFYLPGNLGPNPSSATEVPYGPATVSAIMATAFGIGVMTIVFRRLVSARIALGAGLVLGLGTSNWSISADTAWNHGPTLLFLALGLLAAASSRHAQSGLAFAAAITVRPHVAVAPLALGLAAGWRERRLAPTLWVGALSLIGLFATMWFYGHFFGTPTLRPEQTSAFFTGDVNLTDHGWAMNTLLWLVHPARGLFIFSPFVLILLFGIKSVWPTAPTWVRAAAFSSLLYAIIQTRADVFHAGAGFFGYRGPLETLTLASPLLVLVYAHYVRMNSIVRVATDVTAMASVLVFALGAAGVPALARPPLHCEIARYTAHYRPVEEHIERLRAVEADCPGHDPSEIEKQIRQLQATNAPQQPLLPSPSEPMGGGASAENARTPGRDALGVP